MVQSSVRLSNRLLRYSFYEAISSVTMKVHTKTRAKPNREQGEGRPPYQGGDNTTPWLRPRPRLGHACSAKCPLWAPEVSQSAPDVRGSGGGMRSS